MKIINKAIPQMDIVQFADQHGLEMEIHERSRPIGDPARYYAHFRRADIKNGGVLIGAFGDGSTPEEAIKSYAQRIDMQTLVINAFTEKREEIQVPRLIHE